MEQKLTAAIAGSYPKAKVTLDGYDEPIFKIDEIDFKHDEFTLMRVSDGDIFHEPIYKCQLLLTPLDKISDEDESKCLSIIHENNRLYSVVNFTYFGKLDCHGVDAYQWQRIIDYLRSKGYDCGHGSIPSLIAAGVAVEKEIV